MTFGLQMPYLDAWGSAIGIVVLGAVLTVVVAVAVLHIKHRTAAARSADAAGPGAFQRLGAPGPDPCPGAEAAAERFTADFDAWLDADKPAVWPGPPVVPGRSER